MLISIRTYRWQDVIPRMAADFAVVHLSMIGALMVSVAYQTNGGDGPETAAIRAASLEYYWTFFWALSPIFPIILLLNGVYTRGRGYTDTFKRRLLLQGAVMAALVFFGANFLISGVQIVGRSVAVPFVLLAAAGITSLRTIKQQVTGRYEIRTKTQPTLVRRGGSVLVVGGAGYIGSLLVERLLETGHRVRVLDNLLYGDEALGPVKRNHPKFELIVGDCRNIQDVVKAVRGVDSIVHLAAIVGDPACEQDRESAIETNYAATRMLIEIAKGAGVSRFLFASSCSVYGATDIEMDENSEVRPISLYGQTKVDSERVLLASKSDTFHPTILRFATVFGLGYRPRFDLVVNLLTARAHQDGIITIFNGQQWRPFIHVRDVVEAITLALKSPIQLVSGEIFNVGDTRLNHTLADVGEIIRGAFPDVEIVRTDNNDRRNYHVSFDKLLARTGFRARYTVLDGVEELKTAFERRLIADYTDLRYHNQQYLKAVGSVGHKGDFDALVMAAFSMRPGDRSKPKVPQATPILERMRPAV